MIIASKLRKGSIAEYLLYMWHIENIIRANGLDIAKIRENVIDRFQITAEQRAEMEQWYESLIDMMRREDIVEHGHLQINKNTLSSLADLHNKLLKDHRFDTYARAFYEILPFIVELRAKAGSEPKGEIETCLNALYMTAMLRQSTTEATLEATKSIASFIAVLSAYHKQDEADQLFKEED